jgi:hypothetical protein
MQYQVTIQMTQATVEALSDNGFNLYAFKAVSGPSNGVPVVWFLTQTYGLTTTIQWSESYQAYTMVSTQIGPNTTVTADNPYSIDLGGVLTVETPLGTGGVTIGGDPGAITILNNTSTPFICGITQMVNGQQSPLCAFPLFGNNEDLIEPVEKVFLMFATNTVDTGTVLERSFSQGVLIDLTGVGARQVSYDLNAGWSAESAPWAQICNPNANLVGLLIEPAAVSV